MSCTLCGGQGFVLVPKAGPCPNGCKPRVESNGDLRSQIDSAVKATITMQVSADALNQIKEWADAQDVPVVVMAQMLLLDAINRANEPDPGTDSARLFVQALSNDPKLLDELRTLLAVGADRPLHSEQEPTK